VWLVALAPIVGTALAALAVSARASGSGSSSGTKSLVCSRDDRGNALLHPAPARHGSATTLVPKGAVALTICAYNGMNATGSTPQFGLLGIAVTDSATPLRRLTDGLDAIKPTPPHATYSCPMDDGSQAILYFGYGSGPGDVVTVGTNGCNAITNTAMETISYPAPAAIPHYLGLGKPVIGQIIKLTRPVKLQWATVVGHIRLCGGPAPGRCWTSGSLVGQVVADNSSNVWVAMSQQHKGRFRFTIATPGRYTFRAMGTGKQTNAVLAKTSATVQAGVTTNVVLTIPVP
jgi:hypothetical protein